MKTVLDASLQQIQKWKESWGNEPLIVGISAPQGAGKTYLVSQLISRLPGKVIGFSADDLYLTRKEQLELYSKEQNPLLEYRGLPGTHDVLLGNQIFKNIRNGIKTEIPVYDKSLYNGRGDRSGYRTIEGADIVIFEGWFLGFEPLDQVGEIGSYKKEHISRVNELLKFYKDWKVDCLIQIVAQDIEYVRKWRWEQEVTNKAGLSKEQVDDFIDRFMPMYELYLPHFGREFDFDWIQLKIDGNRQLVEFIEPRKPKDLIEKEQN